MSFVFLIGQIDEQTEVRLTRGMLPFTQPSGLMPTKQNYGTLCRKDAVVGSSLMNMLMIYASS